MVVNRKKKKKQMKLKFIWQISNFLGKNYSSQDDMSESKKNGSTEKSGKKGYMSQEKGHEKRYLLCLQIMYRMLQNLKGIICCWRHHIVSNFNKPSKDICQGTFSSDSHRDI